MATDKSKEYIIPRTDYEYDIAIEKLNPGEFIQCTDDPDMIIIKNDDGTVTLSKKCFSKDCFSK